jgi:hypothetical protein
MLDIQVQKRTKFIITHDFFTKLNRIILISYQIILTNKKKSALFKLQQAGTGLSVVCV